MSKFFDIFFGNDLLKILIDFFARTQVITACLLISLTLRGIPTIQPCCLYSFTVCRGRIYQLSRRSLMKHSEITLYKTLISSSPLVPATFNLSSSKPSERSWNGFIRRSLQIISSNQRSRYRSFVMFWITCSCPLLLRSSRYDIFSLWFLIWLIRDSISLSALRHLHPSFAIEPKHVSTIWAYHHRIQSLKIPAFLFRISWITFSSIKTYQTNSCEQLSIKVRGSLISVH